MLIYGKHSVISALQNKSRKISKLYTTQNSYNHIISQINDETKNRLKKIEIIEVSPSKLDIILNYGINSKTEIIHQGCALETEILQQKTLDEILQSKIPQNLDNKQDNLENNSSLLVIADKITDPQNIGAIIRSSLAFNVDLVLTDERNSPPENAVILKTSAGCFEKLPYVRVQSLVNEIAKLKNLGYKILALDGKSNITIDKYNLKNDNNKIALVIGSEGSGISPHIARECDFFLKININENVESLNASVATSIALYEISKNI